jgi:hypothetical protein
MKLTDKHVELISNLAIEKALAHLEREKEIQNKHKHDRRLRNVKLLLRNYRTFKLHCGDLKAELKYLGNLLDIDDLDSDQFAIESIIKSKKRTLAMVKFIDRMITVFQALCEKSDKEEDKRIFQSVYLLYISEDKNTAMDIATCHKTDTRTVYRDVDKACNTLSTLIFGVDSLRFNS